MLLVCGAIFNALLSQGQATYFPTSVLRFKTNYSSDGRFSNHTYLSSESQAHRIRYEKMRWAGKLIVLSSSTGDCYQAGGPWLTPAVTEQPLQTTAHER